MIVGIKVENVENLNTKMIDLMKTIAEIERKSEKIHEEDMQKQ